MAEFTKTDGESAVYRVDSYDGVNPINVPAKVKSEFAAEHDIAYAKCRAQIVDYGGNQYVIVGECK